jgi:hypothetical protein
MRKSRAVPSSNSVSRQCGAGWLVGHVVTDRVRIYVPVEGVSTGSGLCRPCVGGVGAEYPGSDTSNCLQSMLRGGQGKPVDVSVCGSMVMDRAPSVGAAQSRVAGFTSARSASLGIAVLVAASTALSTTQTSNTSELAAPPGPGPPGLSPITQDMPIVAAA